MSRADGIDTDDRSWLRRLAAATGLGCAGLSCIGLGVVVAAVLGVLWIASRAPEWADEAEAYARHEHAHWPRNTPVRALRTRSPNGRFSTRASAIAAEADLAEASRTHDLVTVQARGCREASILVTEQFHASCQERMNVISCGRPDGRLLHERFAVLVRWLDAQRLETSWTELASLDEKGHRVWSRQREVARVSLRAPANEADQWCEPSADGDRELCVEPIEP